MKAALGAVLAGFPTIQSRNKFFIVRCGAALTPQKYCLNAAAENRAANDCTKFWHGPVDGLHSIENKWDRVAKISLTLKIGGVKTHSFLDSFQGSGSEAASFLQRVSEEETG
ncbi:MAG: hypothetical protein WCC25_21620 [Candidatus Korobacteraceae bacterium]